MIGRIFTVFLGAMCIAAIFAGSAVADPKGRDGPPGQAKKHGKYKSKRGGGPPDWAPAWGYRGKQTIRYERYGRVYETDAAALVRVPDIGLGQCNREVIGAILGGTAGAAVGSQFGKGEGKTLATVGGAIVGLLVGGSIGRSMDNVDQNCVGQVLERAPTGRTVTWQNPDQRGDYSVTPTRTYQTGGGQYCREYQTKIVIDGRVRDAHGTACRQPDGSWKRS